MFKMQEIKSEPLEDPLEPNDECKDTPSESDIFPGYTSVEKFTKDGFKVLIEAIKNSNALPTGRHWDFYNISDAFAKIMKDEGSDVLDLMNQIMQCNSIEQNIRNRVPDDQNDLVIDANDIILDKVAKNIDEMNGIRTVPESLVMQTVSAPLPINGSWNRSDTSTVSSTTSQRSGRNCIKLITARNIIRPQTFFKDKIENSAQYPWCPRITDKPNNLKPLAIFLEEYGDRHEYSHPYEYELDRFMPIAEQLLEEKPKFPMALSKTPLIEIDKPEQLHELVETLRICKEFAVDLEHHSYRSFMGITCLLQISTQDKDYLIDTLALRDKLYILNEVFTKNNIVKIFHGAQQDVEWLQRDLSLYVVNMFDTHQAAKMLQYSALSLAFLMKKFCNVLPNKEFQLSDWRIRPLPKEFKTYAREDTHYLIYIYQMLKKELLDKGNRSHHLLKSVIQKGTEICKRRYSKPISNDDSHMNIYRKCKKLFDNRQMYALKHIYVWRDNLAREEDESLQYVLPNNMLLQISEVLPREMQGIVACCNPVPPLVRSHLLELHQIILNAREQLLENAIFKEDTTGRGTAARSKVNVDASLHCPHDILKSTEFRDDLPVLLETENIITNNQRIMDVKLAIEKSSTYSVFDSNADYDFLRKTILKKVRGFAYFSPYERYKLVKPFVQAEEKAAEAQKKEAEETTDERKDETNAKEVPTEEKTDEERIASIRDHFLKLSKKFSEDLQAQKMEEERKQKDDERTLLEMAGSKKRKRDSETTSCNGQTAKSLTGNNLRNPTPNMNLNFSQGKGKRNKPKKRKFTDVGNCNTEIFDQQNNLRQSNKKRKQNKRQFHNQHQKSQNNQSRGHQQQCSLQQGGVDNAPLRCTDPKNTKQKGPNMNCVPYDYASVDFRQFQGGAGSASGAAQIKQGFRPKNRKKPRSNWAKTSAFNNVNAGNGRGQGKPR